MPVTGRLAVSLFFFMVANIVFRVLEFPKPVLSATGIWLVLEGLLFAWRRRRAQKIRAKLVGMNSQIDQLKEQDFALRYAEAKRAGKFDRWTGKGE